MSTKALRFTTLLFVFMLAIVVPLHAASNATLSIDATTLTDQTPTICDNVGFTYRFTYRADTNDNTNRDYAAATMTDDNGKVLDVDYLSYVVGNDIDDTNTFDSSDPESITARPITVSLYDIGSPDPGIDENSIEGYNFAKSGTLLAQTVIDPATLTINGTCENLPFVSKASPICLALPAGSVVGNTPYQVQVYWEPGKASPGVILNPGNYWVIGTDESGKFYKIMLSCEFVWVPVQNFQPSFEAPQSGQPLPTTIVK